jgi:hypothetical protein
MQKQYKLKLTHHYSWTYAVICFWRIYTYCIFIRVDLLIIIDDEITVPKC